MSASPCKSGHSSLNLNRGNREADENWNNPKHGFSSLVVFGEKSIPPKTMISLTDILIAYYDCRKHKRNSPNALSFELEYESECVRLYEEIASGNYRLRPCSAFIVHDPVKREIFASHFRDRIIHHLIARKLEPFLERVLIHDAYASRRGKGTSYGINRISRFIRACSENYT